MTTVYIVTTGAYSDYGINKVFLDKDLAEKYVSRMSFGPDDYVEIEEYETDDIDREWLDSDESSYMAYIYTDNKFHPWARSLHGFVEDDVVCNNRMFVVTLRAKSAEEAVEKAKSIISDS